MRSSASVVLLWLLSALAALGCEPAGAASGGGPSGGGKADEACGSDGGACEPDASEPPAPSGASFVLVSATLPAVNRRGTEWDTLSNGVERLPDPYFVLARSAGGAPESLVRTPTTRNSVTPALDDPELDWVDDFGAVETLRVEVLDDDGITAQIVCVTELALDGDRALPRRWEVPCDGGTLVVEARPLPPAI